jgi:hypothetical protein
MSLPSLIRIRTNGIQWPYSAAQLRVDEPWLSISNEPHDAELAALATLDPPIVVIRPSPTDPPPYDAATQKLLEGPAVKTDGQWRQAWQVINLPPAPPVADWLGFAEWLYQFPAIASAMSVARVSTDPQGEPATTGLPAALQESRGGNPLAWATTWGQFLLASQMPPEAIGAIVAKATACNLPADFISATTDPSTFIAQTGSV